jgi:hypothetical protein
MQWGQNTRQSIPLGPDSKSLGPPPRAWMPTCQRAGGVVPWTSFAAAWPRVCWAWLLRFGGDCPAAPPREATTATTRARAHPRVDVEKLQGSTYRRGFLCAGGFTCCPPKLFLRQSSPEIGNPPAPTSHLDPELPEGGEGCHRDFSNGFFLMHVPCPGGGKCNADSFSTCGPPLGSKQLQYVKSAVKSRVNA